MSHSQYRLSSAMIAAILSVNVAGSGGGPVSHAPVAPVEDSGFVVAAAKPSFFSPSGSIKALPSPPKAAAPVKTPTAPKPPVVSTKSGRK